MRNAKDVLLSVVGAVADGDPVDWSLAESTPMNQDERSVLAQLKVLERLHGVHQTGSPGSSPRSKLESQTVHAIGDPRDLSSAVADTNIGTAETHIPQHWGPLEIRGVLGVGGFGVVYRAWDPRLASEVALKVLTGEKSSVGATVIEEARLLARVRHPNVVSIYGADRWEGEVGLWMELIRGRTLKHVVQQQGTFGAREAALVGLDLTRALAAVHAAGLVHRDVKPHNVMRDDSGRIVLMDFGAGVELDELTAGPQGKYVGTPLYMAPELFDRHQPSSQSDLYSLGILLYHLVTGSYPVDGASPNEMRLKHLRGERRRLRDARPDLPTEFVRIVERAIDPSTSARYGSAGELETDLARFVVRDEQSPEPAPAAGGPPSRHRWWWSAAALGWATVALAVIALAGVATLRFAPWRSVPVTPAAPVIRSLVVLPFLNLSGDPAEDYFADGMTDLLTADLSMISGLKVISRTSAMSFKGTKRPLPEIAHALNVHGVIEGSIVRKKDRVQITLQIIEAGTDLHLWSQHYEANVADVAALDGEIVRRVAREIGAALTPHLTQRLSAARAVRPDAQDEYLKGKYAGNAYTEAGDREALGHFVKAAALDADYTLAHVALANVYSTLAIQSIVPQRQEYFARARESAARALQLDPDLPGAHLAQANTDFYETWDWTTADAEFRRALELNANDPDAHEQYAWFLAAQGKAERALEHARQGRELDPLGPIRQTTVAGIMYYGGDFPRAAAELEAVARHDPKVIVAHNGLARTYAAMHRWDDAVAEIGHIIAIGGRRPADIADLGRIDAGAGRPADARRALQELQALAGNGTHVGVDNLAAVYVALGDRDRALALLGEGVRERENGVLWFKVDPRFTGLRGDPRFDRLLVEAGLAR